MSLETDLLLDRRRLKRRLFAWRTVAVLGVLAAVLVALRGEGVPLFGKAHLARLTVTGIITDDRRLDETVRKLADNNGVKALIVSIDSPGGSVAGGEGLHDAIAHVAEKKPVVAVMGGTAASAGYMVAVPAARIFAREGTLTGFIRRAELARDKGDQRPDRFAVGEKVDAKIVAVDRAARKLSLTIKGKEVEEEKQAMAEYGSSDSGASLGDILGAAIRRRNQMAQDS